MDAQNEQTQDVTLALDALSIIRENVAALNFDSSTGVDNFKRASRNTRDALDSARFPVDVKKAVDAVIDVASDNYLEALSLLDGRAVSLAAQNKTNRAEAFVVSLYLAVLVLTIWRPACLLSLLVVAIIERLLLKDAYVFNVCASFLAQYFPKTGHSE